MTRILNNCIVNSCSECDIFDDHDQDEGGNYVNRPHCTETGSTVNPDSIDLSCPLQEVEVIELERTGTFAGSPSMDMIKVLLEQWNKIDKIIIVKRGDR